MNKDKELEEAIKYIENFRNILGEDNNVLRLAIETILHALADKDKEIEKLYTIRNEVDYGYENTHIITKDRLVTIEKNKYLIEIEDGKFVDIKEIYENSIPKKKIEDKIEELNNKILKLQKENNYSTLDEIILNQVKKFWQELLEGK